MGALLVIAIAGAALAAGDVSPSKDALVEFFSKAPSRSIDTTDDAVEICTDWCFRYESKHINTPGAWDVIFLHQYYHAGRGPWQQLQLERRELADSLTMRYEKLCRKVEPAARPGLAGI